MSAYFISFYFILSVAIITRATPCALRSGWRAAAGSFLQIPPKPKGGLQTQAPGTAGAFK